VSGIAFAAVALVTSAVLVAGLAWVARRVIGLPVGAILVLRVLFVIFRKR
jgi:hypothetical protein